MNLLLCETETAPNAIPDHAGFVFIYYPFYLVLVIVLIYLVYCAVRRVSLVCNGYQENGFMFSTKRKNMFEKLANSVSDPDSLITDQDPAL